MVVSERNSVRHAVLGQTVLVQTVLGQTVLGQTVLGQTVLGQTVLGQTVLGQTVLGQTVLGQTVLGTLALIFGLLASPQAGFSQTVSNTSIRPFVTGFVPVVGRNGAIGGVSVDANGIVTAADRKVVTRLSQLRRDALDKIPPAIGTESSLRKVSLRGIEEAIAAALKEGRPISDEIQYLGGLVRINYVFVYPQERDVVLAGPSEAWVVDSHGSIVGSTSKRPVLLLEDLLIALRTAENAREEAISCSINPGEEGIRRFQAFMRRQRTFSPAVIDGIEKSLGPQTVTVRGVPNDSHFARVLVASDCRMKRIAMKLEDSPVDGLVSYLDMVQSDRRGEGNMMPRWWLTCDYEPIGQTDDGLAYELRGPGVMAMTELDFINEEGKTAASGKKSLLAQKWADQLTSHYEELSRHSPIFGELRNIMDMSVVAALIAKEGLLHRANLDTPNLSHSEGPLQVGSWHAPTTIATECSFVKKGRNWIITASGGVEINSWRSARQRVRRDQLAQLRATHRITDADSWWWD